MQARIDLVSGLSVCTKFSAMSLDRECRGVNTVTTCGFQPVVYLLSGERIPIICDQRTRGTWLTIVRNVVTMVYEPGDRVK